ncbi:hypothetical protein BG011_007160 [Mortierella polycephala]|uniref:Mitochondrial resolvase Ydc2 catalytic domain-containing protein n=1 Tax=Mortierella polycephala TaxID=41804 RepID=A0A9P6QFC9_9FUNG|nr:hypothetical protein BG011_007160 [Mortierella polycephala]
MTDDTYEDILPLRIEHHPDIVLFVVEEDQEYDNSTSSTIPVQSPSSSTTKYDNYASTSIIDRLPNNFGENSMPHLTKQLQLDIPTITHQYNQVGHYRKHPERPTGMETQTQNSFRSYQHLHHLYLKAIMAGQAIQAEGIKDAMKEHSDSLKVEMDRNRALQETIHQIQQEMLDKQEQMHKQTLDHFATIQSRVHAILTQGYELHEYTIPRLFIILPKANRRRNKFVKPFMNQFRLFFLCECGTHTMIKGSKILHEIHLAKHEGYDIDQPTEFFDRYGSYVLAMMQMIKFGITTASLVVTPLAISTMSEVVQKYIDFTTKNFGELVDQTISCIQTRQSSPDGAVQEFSDGNSFHEQEVLEGADLRQLESYLKVKDEGRVLGNLYRIVTHNGHVKWVCIDHYQENYQESAIKRLREIVDASGGSFEQELGKIDITLTTKVVSVPFYDALVKTRGIQELSIKLDWDVTMDDLRAFETAMTKANIVHLTLDGGSFKGARLDFVNRGRRFEPIAQLMSNGRIQVMRLQGINDFYKRIGKPTTTAVPRLRRLSIDTSCWTRIPDELAGFKKILRHNSSLVELDIATHYPSDLLAIVTSTALGQSSLKTVSMHTDVCDIVVDLIQGRIRTAVATMYPQANFRRLVDTFIFEGHLTKLCLEADIFDSGKLSEIIEGNPKLLTIEMIGPFKGYYDVIDKMVDARKRILTKSRALSPSRLILRPETNMSKTNAVVVTMELEFENKIDVSDATVSVHMPVESPDPNFEKSALEVLFRRYGWSIETLVTSQYFTDDHADALLKAIESRGSSLTKLALNTAFLTARGSHNMAKVLDQSTDLVNLSFDFKDLHTEARLVQALVLLKKYGARMNGVTLSGFLLSGSWMKAIADRFPSRHLWPKLTTFGVEGLGKCSSDIAEWIESMVSSATHPSRPDPMANPNPSQLAKSWTPLKEISLCFIEAIESMEWQGIIETLDFTSLETLNIESANFGVDHLQILVDCIPDDGTAVPLRTLTVVKTGLTRLDETEELWEELRNKAPLAVQQPQKDKEYHRQQFDRSLRSLDKKGLSSLLIATGQPLTGTKPDLKNRLATYFAAIMNRVDQLEAPSDHTGTLYSTPTLFSSPQLPSDIPTSGPHNSTQVNDSEDSIARIKDSILPQSIVSIDIGIRNLAWVELSKDGEILRWSIEDLLVSPTSNPVQDTTILTNDNEDDNDQDKDQPTDQGLLTSTDPKTSRRGRRGTKKPVKKEVAPPYEPQSVALRLDQVMRTIMYKSNTIGSVIIERQRFRTSGMHAILDATFKCGVVEGMIYTWHAARQHEQQECEKLRERSYGEGNVFVNGGVKHVSIESVFSRAVAEWWSTGASSKSTSTSRKKREVIEIEQGEKEEASEAIDANPSIVEAAALRASRMRRHYNKKRRSRDIVDKWIFSNAGNNDKQDHIGTLASEPASRLKVTCSPEIQEWYSQERKRDDLSDCLLQAVAWYEWRKRAIHEAVERSIISNTLDGPAVKNYEEEPVNNMVLKEEKLSKKKLKRLAELES